MLITCRGNRIKLKYIYTSKSFFSVLFCFFFSCGFLLNKLKPLFISIGIF